MEWTAEQYVDDVISGRQVACRWVRLACERHRRDLDSGGSRSLRFDAGQAKLAVAFYSVCRHSKGRWAGQPIVLEGWQQFVVWSLFGWQRRNEEAAGGWSRRFRTCYLEVARKNGKSTLLSGIGLKLLVADGESGAEVYTAATKREQARIIHGESVRMVRQSAELQREVELFKDNINHPATFSKYEPLGADSKTADGLNIHGALIDELHAHPNGDLYQVLNTATSARVQPLIFMITTAGSDPASFCMEQRNYTEAVLEGAVEDDRHFGVIYTLDEGDDWRDERVWVKANPNLDVSKSRSDLRAKARRAQHVPSERAAFQRLDMNLWLNSADRWVDWEKWRACGRLKFDEGQLAGRRCFGGLDLSSVSDITAWALLFPPVPDAEDELARRWVVLTRFFLPEAAVQARSQSGVGVRYDEWVRMGLIQVTPGNVLDYDWVYAQIDRDAQTFDVERVGFDRWGSTQIVNRLIEMGGEGWVVQIGQGFRDMSAPMRGIEERYLAGMLATGGHAVLDWMASNVVAVVDPAGNVKPDKSKSREKIDGVVALINAAAVADRAGPPTRSVYEGRGIRLI